MTAYRLTEGGTLVVRVDDGPWQTLVFDAARLPATTADAGVLETTAEEISEIIDALDGVTGAVDGEGGLVLATLAMGQTSVLVVASTAAAALGLGPGNTVNARGLGPRFSSLTCRHGGPYALPPEASMSFHVDGKARQVAFGHENRPPPIAEDVAAQINRTLRGRVARATGDGRVRITSSTLASALVSPSPGRPRTYPTLRPSSASPARRTAIPTARPPVRLTCQPAAETALVENLTSASIELRSPTGRSVLPARGSLGLTRDLTADSLLVRLVAPGTVRISPERTP